MSEKVVRLKEKTALSCLTEMMYEIASARAEGIGLIRLLIADDSTDNKKILSSIIRRLKQMKQGNQIQLFVTPDAFSKGTTEAVFLVNKYPEISISNLELNEGETFIYIKI